ncbi:MAG: hypothetical protein A2X47_05505 [Lentisphaerae bacterium GWF2_38_69]|nr:MAG: hypothetical protein A2X47_05505 [Lentisphaerae bacterium GWF2_38_69]
MITREADYAIRAMILSAIYQKSGEPLTTTILAEKMEIPYRFLRKIMMKLRETGYIDTKKGKFGGVKLKKKANEISVLDIINIFSSSSIFLNKCIKESKPCDGRKECKLHKELTNIQTDLHSKLSSITVDKLI